jgi:hypothetical protein
MSTTHRKHLFIIPGEEIANANPRLFPVLQRANLTWQDFLQICLANFLEELNRGRLGDWDGKTLYQQEDLEDYIVEVLEAMDIIEDDNDYLAFYKVISKATTDVINAALRYTDLMLRRPANPPPNYVFAYEVNIERVIEPYNVVFSVSYAVHPTLDDRALRNPTHHD